VYWTRRLLVVLLVLAVVFVAARLVGGRGSGGNEPSARPVGADQTTASTSPAATATRTATDAATDAASDAASGETSAGGTPSGGTTAPASPSGTCRSSDIVALPSVASPAYAAHPVIVSMTLTTRSAPACTWKVSADSLVVKVTSKGKRFWSTQDCRAAVPDQTVVVRRDTPTTIAMSWNGMRSDADCTRTTTWAEPGYYHVIAAAFGAEPADTGFRLLTPVRPTVTASPSQSASGQPPSDSPAASGSPRR
jgi:hypothetical protein